MPLFRMAVYLSQVVLHHAMRKSHLGSPTHPLALSGSVFAPLGTGHAHLRLANSAHVTPHCLKLVVTSMDLARAQPSPTGVALPNGS